MRIGGHLKTWARRVVPEQWLVHMQAADHYLRGEPEIRLLRRLCNPRKAAIDIGANIGTYSYFMRRHAAQVIAYEPNPLLAERLCRLFPDISVRPVALSDREGTLTLRVPIREGRPVHELGSITQHFRDEGRVEEHRVDVQVLDQEDFGGAEIGFIKIDVEQNEIPVLRGAREIMERHQPIIMTEVTPLLYPKALPDMFSFITQNRFHGYFTFRGSIISFSKFNQNVHANKDSYHDAFMNNNIFFLPEASAPESVFGARYRANPAIDT